METRQERDCAHVQLSGSGNVTNRTARPIKKAWPAASVAADALPSAARAVMPGARSSASSRRAVSAPISKKRPPGGPRGRGRRRGRSAARAFGRLVVRADAVHRPAVHQRPRERGETGTPATTSPAGSWSLVDVGLVDRERELDPFVVRELGQKRRLSAAPLRPASRYCRNSRGSSWNTACAHGVPHRRRAPALPARVAESARDREVAASSSSRLLKNSSR